MEKRPFFRAVTNWGNTTRAATAGLGSIGLIYYSFSKGTRAMDLSIDIGPYE